MVRSRVLLLSLGYAAMPGCSTAVPSGDPQVAAAAAGEPSVEVRDFGRFFGSIEGAFVLLDPQEKRMIVHNPQRARTRFIPASTFKIPNTLIALETGVASGPEFALAWDSVTAPRQSWWPAAWAGNHTLATALPNSVVWYYQELARRTGPQRMQTFLDRLEYGNRDISGGIDQFWLSGGLRISPIEQVDFLRRFHAGELGVSARATRIARELLTLEETPSYRFSGKTGWAALPNPSEPEIGWFVGYLEREGKVYLFATNIQVEKNEDAAERIPITKAILVEMGLIDR